MLIGYPFEKDKIPKLERIEIVYVRNEMKEGMSPIQNREYGREVDIEQSSHDSRMALSSNFRCRDTRQIVCCHTRSSASVCSSDVVQI